MADQETAAVCAKCPHSLSLHDAAGCQAQWGSVNDREFCQCSHANPGNVVPSQWARYADEDDDEPSPLRSSESAEPPHGSFFEELQGAERIAEQFHEAYERLAPSFGYETRRESAKPWSDVPENNRRLMTAVCHEVVSARLSTLEAEHARLKAAIEWAMGASPDDEFTTRPEGAGAYWWRSGLRLRSSAPQRDAGDGT